MNCTRRAEISTVYEGCCGYALIVTSDGGMAIVCQHTSGLCWQSQLISLHE